MSRGLAALSILLIAGMTMANDVRPKDVRLTRQFSKDHPVEFKPEFPNRSAWEKRAGFLRHQAMVALGLWPMPGKTPLNPVIHGRIDRDAYTIEKVYFASLPGHYVSGNLYRPKKRTGKLPAVLSPYGHWPDGRFIWKSDESIEKDIDSSAERDVNAARSPLQANCAMLARMGCLVFTYDMVGYGDSTKIPHRQGFLDPEAVLRAQSFMGLQTWNSVRALDFLLSLPDVDPQRIAVTGSSSGGTQTIALNAVDPRAAVAFPMVMISMNMQGGCVCENAPLYRIGTNNVELACLFAPKPEGAAAANDWTHDFETRGLPEMKSIWRLFGAEDNVAGKHVNFEHNHNLHSRELQYNFLNRHLKLGLDEPVKEQPFQPVPPQELRVYDDAHPMPSDFLDAAALRKQLTQASAAQLAALKPDKYIHIARVALQAIVVDEVPDGSQVELGDGFIARAGSGERVPCKLLKPAGDAKGVVVLAHTAAGSDAVDEARMLVESGMAVLAIELLDFPPPKSESNARSDPNPPYSAYVNGYNRTPIANHVHDLLTAIAVARRMSPKQPVHLLAFGDAGPAALLARALAGEAIDRAAIDLNQFDFDRISSDTDPMLLPGALKYGGIYGFVPLLQHGDTLVCNARRTGRFEWAARSSAHVELHEETRDPPQMMQWLIRR